jgi:hypothetical protein
LVHEDIPVTMEKRKVNVDDVYLLDDGEVERPNCYFATYNCCN